MNRMMKIYYYAVLGAIGGLFAWQVSNLIGLSFTPSLYVNATIVGALIGFLIGFLIGAVEGIVSRNPKKALLSGAIIGGLGLIGGAIGLPIAEGLFQVIGGYSWARPFGWGLFGLLTGAATAYKGGSQAWKGAIGGFAGGVLGGAMLEFSRANLSDPLLGKAVGLILMGAAVGGCIALIVFTLSKAWFEVKSGKLKGMAFILDKFLQINGPTAIIGSSSLKADIALPDPDILPQHAMLQGGGNYFNLKDMSMTGTFVNNKRVEQTRLSNQQVIRMGNTELVYHEKR
ncbi:MAG: FHA domain-containing protein [Leptolinea sp.]